jgi:hypothetical protein
LPCYRISSFLLTGKTDAAVKESLAAAEYYDLPLVAAEDDIATYKDERPINANASNP